jgi:hypothetical protein
MVPSDVSTFIARKFDAADQSAAQSLLATAILHDGSQASPRLLRCAVVSSRGSIAKLQYYVKMLTIDWRDVISAGEYESVDKHLSKVRDLTIPIEDDP